MSAEPGPCRFCTSAVTYTGGRGGDGFVVCCAACGAQGPVAFTRELAARYWNESIATVQARIEAARHIDMHGGTRYRVVHPDHGTGTVIEDDWGLKIRWDSGRVSPCFWGGDPDLRGIGK